MPVELSYSSNSAEPNLYTHTMTLGKRTQAEAEIAALRAEIAELAEKVGHIEQELEILPK